MAEEQAVVDQANTEPEEVSADAGSAQDDNLESLLTQYDSYNESEEDSDTSGQSDDPKKKLEYIEQHLRRQDEERAQETVQRDLDSTAKNMRESIKDQLDVPEDLLKDILQGRAATDRRVISAWNNRHKDKASWEKTASAIAKDFVKKLNTNLDRSTTSDRDAVASAVRSASKGPPADDGPSETDFNKMSDAEFEKLKRQALK